MLNELQPKLTAEVDAMRWAHNYFPTTRKKLIRSTPWAKVYMLASESELAVLKVVPRHLTAAPTVAPILAKYFPNNVPGVIASDQELGLLLMHDYNGTEMRDQSTDEQLQQLVETYASIQAVTAGLPELLSCLPTFDIAELLTDMFEFIRPSSDSSNVGAVVHAEFYLNRKTLDRYYTPLMQRRYLLEDLLALTKKLPTTINHCDLRRHNAAKSTDGSCILYDWDNVIAGPAGMSLHTLFKGCSIPSMLLAGEDIGDHHKARRKSELLNAYLSALAAEGYADVATLKQCLPASVLAGALRYLVYYSKYPKDTERYKSTVAPKLRKRLSDLLDLCDHLSLKDRNKVLEYALDYKHNRRHDRASYLLKHHLRRHPNDADAQALLGIEQAS